MPGININNENFLKIKESLKNSALPLLTFVFSALAGYSLMFFWLGSPKSIEGFNMWCCIIFGAAAGLMSLWVTTKISKKIKDGNHFYTIAAFVFSFLGLCLAFASIEAAPFGTNTMISADLYYQYIPFMLDLRDRVLGGESLIYAENLVLGTGYLPHMAYYLLSPFNLLIFIFPRSEIHLAVMMITLLKTACAGAAFSLFLRYEFKKNNWLITAVSVMYALSAYSLVYSRNLSWLDGMILLPLVMAGVVKIIKDGKISVYVITLSLSLMTQFYIGLIILAASVIFFCVKLFEEKRTREIYLKKLTRIAVSSLIAIGISAVILIPSLIAFSHTYQGSEAAIPQIGTNLSFVQIISRMLFATSISDGGQSFLYCGAAVLLLFPVYILSSANTRKKLCNLAFMGIMLISMVVNIPNVLWRGNTAFSFEFIVVFALLYISSQVIFSSHKVKAKYIAAGLGVVFIALLYFENTQDISTNFRNIYLSFLFIVVYSAFLTLLYGKYRGKNAVTVLFAIVIMVETISFGVLAVRGANEKQLYYRENKYVSNFERLDGVKEQISQLDPGYEYRGVQFPAESFNDALSFGFKDFTTFSSMMDMRIPEFLRKLGYDCGNDIIRYESKSPPADSLLGLKFFVTESGIEKSDYALPTAYFAGENLKNWQINSNNPFKVINSFFESSCEVADVYEIIPIRVSFNESANASMADSDTIELKLNEGSNNGYFSLKGKLLTDARTYLYSDFKNTASIHMLVDDEKIDAENTPFVQDMGDMNAGTDITVNINAKSSQKNHVCVAQLNVQKLEEALSRLSLVKMNITGKSGSKITGTVNTPVNGYLMTTIGYSEGWSIKIDGKKTETFAAGEGLLSVPLSAGEHKITMQYTQPGLIPGIIISILSLTLFAVLFKGSFLKKKIKGLLKK